jgi:hypothetical protein
MTKHDQIHFLFSDPESELEKIESLLISAGESGQ